MPQPQQPSPCYLKVTEHDNDAPHVTINGMMEGGQYLPDYYAYETMPECSWEEGLQAIDEFDWAIDEKEDEESGPTQSAVIKSIPDVIGRHDDLITTDALRTSDYARDPQQYPSPSQSEPVTSNHSETAGVKTTQASKYDADHEMSSAMEGMEDVVVSEVMVTPITPKSFRAMSLPVRLSMSPGAPSSRLSAPDDLEVQPPITNRGKALEAEIQGHDTSEACGPGTMIVTPETEDIKVTIVTDHEQQILKQHKTKVVYDCQPWEVQPQEAAIANSSESTFATLPELLLLGYGQGGDKSEATESTGQVNNTSSQLDNGPTSTSIATIPSHEEASPSTNILALPVRDLPESEIDIVSGNVISDDSECIHLVGQPSKETNPAPIIPSPRNLEDALTEDRSTGAVGIEEASPRSSTLALPTIGPDSEETTQAQEQLAPEDSTTAIAGGDARKRDRLMRAEDSSDSEKEAPEKKRARPHEPESDPEEFYDATDKLEDANTTPGLFLRRQAPTKSPMADKAKPAAIQQQKKEPVSRQVHLQHTYIDNRQVSAPSIAKSQPVYFEEDTRPDDESSAAILPSEHDDSKLPLDNVEVDYDMQEHFSDIHTQSPTHLSDAQTPPLEKPMPAFHRSPKNIVSNRELAALGSTLAPGMHLGSPLHRDKGKRKRKSASSIAGERVYFEGDVEYKDDESEIEAEVDTPVVKKSKTSTPAPRVDTRYKDGRMRIRPEAKQKRVKVEDQESADEKEVKHVLFPKMKGKELIPAPVALPSKRTPTPAAKHGKRHTRGDTKDGTWRARSVAQNDSPSGAEDIKSSGKKPISSTLRKASAATSAGGRNKFGFTPPKTRARASLASAPGSSAGSAKTVAKGKGTPKANGDEGVRKERRTRGAAAKEEKEKNIGKRLRSGDA